MSAGLRFNRCLTQSMLDILCYFTFNLLGIAVPISLTINVNIKKLWSINTFNVISFEANCEIIKTYYGFINECKLETTR